MRAGDTGPAGADPVATIADARARTAEARRRFDLIGVPYAPQDAAVDMLDEVRLAAIGRRHGGACGGAILVAPHGTGKTRTIEMLRDTVNYAPDVPEGQIPVLHVKLSTVGTVDSIPSQILRALGRPKPDAGKESIRWNRAMDATVTAGVQLILIDEFNRASRRPTMSGPIAGAIRERIVDEGIAPIAIIGSEDAGSVLRSAPDLMERLDDQIDLEPMDWVHDEALFIGFVGALDAAIVANGILRDLSGLGGPEIAEKLCFASGGRLRRIMKIVRVAMAEVVRRGGGSITMADFADAVGAYATVRRFIDHNPFEKAAK